jgi:hypothetical protein
VDLRKLKLTNCAAISGLPDVGLALRESQASRNAAFGRQTAPGLSALGSIEVAPVGAYGAEVLLQVCGRRMATAPSLRPSIAL